MIHKNVNVYEHGICAREHGQGHAQGIKKNITPAEQSTDIFIRYIIYIYTLHVRSKYSANKSEWLFVAKSQVAAAKNCSMRKQQTNTNEKKREITEARKRKSTHWGKKRQVHC